jgi:hypothetical protein
MFFDHWNSLDALLSTLQDQPGGFGQGLPQSFQDLSVPCLELLREIVNEGKIFVVDFDSALDTLNGKG